MNSIKKRGAYGVAVSVVLVAALALVLGTSQVVQAAAPTTVNVIIDEMLVDDDDPTQRVGDDDSVVASSKPITVRIVVDVDDDDETGTDGSQTDETVVTISTTTGTFENGLGAISIQCAIDGVSTSTVTVDDDDDAVVDSATVVGISEGGFDNTPEDGTSNTDEDPGSSAEGCLGVDAFLTLAGGTSPGHVVITASTLNGKSGADVLLVTAARAGTNDAKRVSLKADATVISGAGSVDKWSVITLTTQDSDGEISSLFKGNFLVTTDLGWLNIGTDCNGTNRSASAIVNVEDMTSGEVNLCAGASDSGTATVTASDVAGGLTGGSVTVEVNGNVASWAPDARQRPQHRHLAGGHGHGARARQQRRAGARHDGGGVHGGSGCDLHGARRC